MGEISDALRRARNDRSSDPRERDGGPAPPSSEVLSRRVERRSIPRHEPDAIRPPVAARAEAHRLSLSRGLVGDWRARAVVADEQSHSTESFRHLALRVRAELERRSLRSVIVTGPLRSEGKTTVACNMALALASVRPGREVALVDLDLRRPRVAIDFQLATDVGVEDVIAGVRKLSEVCVPIERPAVDVFPAVRPNESAHELLAQPGLASLVRELERHYATVIIDTPPALLLPDTSLILEQVGAYIAVARSGATRERAFRSMLDMLRSDRLLGTVLNEGALPTHRKHYGYYSEAPERASGE